MSGVFIFKSSNTTGHLWKSTLHFSEATINNVSIFLGAPWGGPRVWGFDIVWAMASLKEDRDRSTISSFNPTWAYSVVINQISHSNFSTNNFWQASVQDNTSIEGWIWKHLNQNALPSLFGWFHKYQKLSNVIITGDLESQSWLKR